MPGACLEAGDAAQHTNTQGQPGLRGDKGSKGSQGGKVGY